MNIREIEILLDKYFEAETSVEEEKLLRHFFLSGEAPAHLQQHVSLFKFADAEQNLVMQANVEKNLLNRINSGRAILYASRRFWYLAAGVAAAVLVLFAIFTETKKAVNGDPEIASHTYSHEEIQLAYVHIQEALYFTSSKLNQGTAPLNNISKINAGAEIVNQLAKFDQGITEMNRGLRRIDEGAEHFNKLSKFNLLIHQ
jgi:hypothetical protein